MKTPPIAPTLDPLSPLGPLFVPETRVGFWFLGTKTWIEKVIRVAIKDLLPLMDDRRESYDTIVDVGCGQGLSFSVLNETFKPQRLIGVEYETKTIETARARAKREGIAVELLQNDCAEIALPDGIADIVFCHQTCHHLVRQEQALAEFYRLLKPGGVLLFAESTKAYIHSWIIRWLFAHPMDKQRTAQEYMDMVRAAGFEFEDRHTSFPYLWWSRADLAIAENIFRIKPKPFGQREETLVNLVAYKPR